MQLKDVLDFRLPLILRDASVQEAAQAMDRTQAGALIVQDAQHTAIGIVTDRDVVIRAIATGANPSETPIDEFMTSTMVGCSDTDTPEEAAEIMKRNHVQHLVVFDKNDEVVGLVSITELASVMNDKSKAGAAASAPPAKN